MKRWKTEQDSLLKWKLSQGSSSQKAQWLLARYMNEDDRATSLEKEIVASPAENRFRLFLRFYNNLNTSKR